MKSGLGNSFPSAQDKILLWYVVANNMVRPPGLAAFLPLELAAKLWLV